MPPGDIDGLAAALGSLAANGELRRSMGGRALERASAHFDVNETMRRLQEELLRGPAVRAG